MTLPQLSPMLPGTTLGTSSQPQFTCQLLQALGALRRLGWQEPGKLERHQSASQMPPALQGPPRDLHSTEATDAY